MDIDFSLSLSHTSLHCTYVWTICPDPDPQKFKVHPDKTGAKQKLTASRNILRPFSIPSPVFFLFAILTDEANTPTLVVATTC